MSKKQWDDHQPLEGTFVYGSGSLWREGAGWRRGGLRAHSLPEFSWTVIPGWAIESVKQTTASQINDKISWRKEVWCVPMGKDFIFQAIWGSRALRLYRLVQGPTQDWINGAINGCFWYVFSLYYNDIYSRLCSDPRDQGSSSHSQDHYETNHCIYHIYRDAKGWIPGVHLFSITSQCSQIVGGEAAVICPE